MPFSSCWWDITYQVDWSCSSSYKLKSLSALQELGQDKQRIEDVFQELFPNWSTNEDDYGVTALTKAYHKYKKEYVKQLVFTDAKENSSMWILHYLIPIK